MLAQIDLTPITSALSELSSAVVSLAAVVIPAGVALGALFFGGIWAYRLFKGFADDTPEQNPPDWFWEQDHDTILEWNHYCSETGENFDDGKAFHHWKREHWDRAH